MTEYKFPLPSASTLAERLAEPPRGVTPRHWVMRDDNQQHHHGVIPLVEDPIYLDLWWKPSVRGREQQVGMYKLHLRPLLDAGYVRAEGERATDVRLRFYRGDRGVVVIQIGQGDPALPIGMVDPSLE